jgi:DNA-binding LytR/AlgR family response regulator
MYREWGREVIASLFRCVDLISVARYARPHAGEQCQANCTDRARPVASPLLYLRVRGGVRGVAPDQILGVRSSKDYTHVWLSDGSTIQDHRSLSVWLGMLPTTKFLRIHRTAAVNLAHVCGLNRSAGHDGARWDVHLRSVDNPGPSRVPTGKTFASG